MTTGEVLGNLGKDTKSLHDGLSIPGVVKRGEYHLHAGDSGRRPPEPPSWPQYLKDEKKYQYAISAFVSGAVSLETVRSGAGEVVGLAVNTDPQVAVIPESDFSYDVDFNNGVARVEEADEVTIEEVSEDGLVVGALSRVMDQVTNHLQVAA